MWHKSYRSVVLFVGPSFNMHLKMLASHRSLKLSHIFCLKIKTLSFDFIRCSTEERMVGTMLEVTSGAGVGRVAMLLTAFSGGSSVLL